MNTRTHGYRLLLALTALLLAGCAGQRVLMPTPNLHLDGQQDVFANLDPALKTTQVPVYYVTDQVPERDPEGNLRYGFERSTSLAFGKVLVGLGRDASWEELVAASRSAERVKPLAMEILKVEELVRSVETPLPFTEVDGQIFIKPDVAAQLEKDKQAVRRLLSPRLELADRKELFLFVHGYNNSFDDAAFAMAELWHFLGRFGVPVIYTWPAGYPGLFGYTSDRESSEFTVYHLRHALEMLSSFPEVEKIHLIAHSRGTDVALNAVRELSIQARAAGEDPRKRFKIHNLILAAPDLDLQVAATRVIGDQLTLSADRFTVYTSPGDKAIGVAAKLFQSPRGRLGTFGADRVPPALRAAMDYSGANVAIVNFPATSYQGDRYGHSYFRDAPSVSSDLVLMLRDDLDPGPPGRPLERLGNKFWRVPSGYPAAEPTSLTAPDRPRKPFFVH